ncbi:hypothetical protein [Algoriphagus terrigena]|nr:hypothetical protein [Algoriphagus terrigena]
MFTELCQVDTSTPLSVRSQSLSDESWELGPRLPAAAGKLLGLTRCD